MMPERANRTFICSVLFLDIAEYSKKPVSEQIQLKDRFNALIAESSFSIPATAWPSISSATRRMPCSWP